MAELLPWLNLLLVPVFGLVVKISASLARLEARQDEQGRQLERHDRQLERHAELHQMSPRRA